MNHFGVFQRNSQPAKTVSKVSLHFRALSRHIETCWDPPQLFYGSFQHSLCFWTVSQLVRTSPEPLKTSIFPPTQFFPQFASRKTFPDHFSIRLSSRTGKKNRKTCTKRPKKHKKQQHKVLTGNKQQKKNSNFCVLLLLFPFRK